MKKKILRFFYVVGLIFCVNDLAAKTPLYIEYIAPTESPKIESAILKSPYNTGLSYTRESDSTGFWNNYYITVPDNVEIPARPGQHKLYAFSDTVLMTGFALPQTFLRKSQENNRVRYLYPDFGTLNSYDVHRSASSDIGQDAKNGGWDDDYFGTDQFGQYCHTNWIYKISFSANGGSGVMTTQSITNSGTLAANKFTKTGYTFAGWKVGSTTYADKAKVTPTDDMTLVAQWTANKYTITANVASTGGGSVTGGGSYDYSSVVTLTATPSTGWLFDSWSNGAKTQSIKVTVSGNATYTATFKRVTYRLAFHPNCSDATGVMPTNSYTYGTENTLPINKYVRNGWDFKGWATSASGNWSIGDGASISVPGSIFTGAEPGALKVLYAYWEKHAYTVTLDKKGGAGGTSAISAYSSEAMPQITIPSRIGYMFKGYYTGVNGVGVKYYNDDGSSAKNFDLGENVTLYAFWTAKSSTVTFNPNGGNDPSFPTKTVSYDSAYGDLPTVTRDDSHATGYTTYYTFNGWFTSSSGGNKILPETVVDKENNHTLYAQWISTKTANSYTVTFDLNGGSGSIAQISVTYDSYYPTMQEPTRTGYTFNGWYTAKSGGYQVNESIRVTTASSHTLYARWSPITYTISYNGNGSTSGTMSDSTSLNYDQEYTLRENYYSKSGASFQGWALTADGDVVYANKALVKNLSNEDNKIVILYAVWRDKKITVTFNSNGGNASTPSSIEVTYGKTYGELAVATKDDENTPIGHTTSYTFDGWFTKVSGGDKVLSDTTVTDENDHTLYAHWVSQTTANVYTVTFDPMGGEVTPTEIAVTYGQMYKNLPKPVKIGYKFVDWRDAESNIVDDTVNVTAASNHVLYAHWGTYNLTLDAREGKFDGGAAITNIPCVLGENYTKNLPIPSRNGYVFAGWWTEAGVQKIDSDVITEDGLCLYARWKENSSAVEEMDLIFDYNDGSQRAITNKVVKYTAVGAQYISSVHHVEGDKYLFFGWSTAKDGGDALASDTEVSGEMTVYARWSLKAMNEATGNYDILFEGDTDWYEETDEALKYNGQKTIRSGNSNVNTESKIRVTAYGSGTLSWKYKTYGRAEGRHPDSLTWGEGGDECTVEGECDWSDIITPESFTNAFQSIDIVYKVASGNSYNGYCAWLSDFVWTPSTSTSQIDSWDSAVELKREPTNAIFETGGATNWVVTTDVVDAGANAIAITNLAASRSSWARMTVKGAGELRFKWKVNSERGYTDSAGQYQKCDYLEFCDGENQVAFIDGDSNGFIEVVYTNKLNSSHIFTWRYVKDGSDTEGDASADAAYVDSVVWTPIAPVNPEPGESDRPVISSFANISDGAFSLSIANASALFDYELRGSNTLSAPLESWPILEKKSGVDGALEFTRLVQEGENAMFYYIRVKAKD